MTAWGKTGRVEIWDALTGAAVDVGIRRVLVDGVFAGMIWPLRGGRTRVSLGDGWVDEEPATRDEAVMWVLRRARPDVWREERPVVWKVCKDDGTWDIRMPNGSYFWWSARWGRAFALAHSKAQQEWAWSR